MDVHRYQQSGNDYDSLSLRDLLEARDVYHAHLIAFPHVVATAVGRYRIRKSDPWPSAKRRTTTGGSAPRTLSNSEVRPYSWPAILVFVDQWIGADKFGQGKQYDPREMVPKTLYLENGRKVPVCIVAVERNVSDAVPVTPRYPLNNIGGGMPVVAEVQGREHVATISCLVSDGHKTYALTNRHVAGPSGNVLYSWLDGARRSIGTASALQLSRLPFTDVYREFRGRDVYVNVDAALIEIDDLSRWTAKVQGIGRLGALVDLPPSQLSLSLVGCRVVGVGAASGEMTGEIAALLYRYKSVGGFEYLADYLIGPRDRAKDALTRRGDSGALWMFDPRGDAGRPTERSGDDQFRPFALQWGQQVFADDGTMSYALATTLSTICNLLNVDLIRDWNLDDTNTWGAVGHFSIAHSVTACLTNRRLKSLMTANAELISPSDVALRSSEFKGMGTADFVPLADVPDMYWKPRIAKQGYARPFEGPNHFADMDQPRETDGADLLTLMKSSDFLDPMKWNDFYDSITDLLSGDAIEQRHRGLLPFRVWQIFNDMVRFAKAGKAAQFVCAAGVLTHYVGDACQPLHISYLHDGDPEQPTTKTVNHRDGTSDDKIESLGAGVHAAYEDKMVSANRDAILDGLAQTEKVRRDEIIRTGKDAGLATVELMRTVFTRIPPRSIVDFYIASDAMPKQLAEDMWTEFGDGTLECMKDGVHLLARLWQSAWLVGGGDDAVADSAIKAITRARAMKICQDPDFMPSVSIGRIGAILAQRT